VLSKLFLLSLFCIISCGDIVDEAPASLNIPKKVSRWDLERIKSESLDIRMSEEFYEFFAKKDEDKNGFNPIEQMAHTWNMAHPELDFYSLPFIRTEEKAYAELKEYRDDEMGIYLSRDWFEGHSSASLGITQFWAKRFNEGKANEYLMLVHADIIINFRDHDYSITKEEEKYDLYTVILHEMGHMIGLPHPRRLGEEDAVMAPRLGKGEIKRKLLPNDFKALFKTYPISDSKYFFDIPDQTAPFNLFREPEEERFIVEFLKDGHKHYHHNGKYISCEKNIH